MFYEFISYKSILGTEILPQGKFEICVRNENELFKSRNTVMEVKAIHSKYAKNV